MRPQPSENPPSPLPGAGAGTTRPPRLGRSAADDPRLLAAVKEYLEAAEAGRRFSRRRLLAHHAGPDGEFGKELSEELSEELSACLQGLAFVRSAASQFLRDAGQIPASGAASVRHGDVE